jgi:hypothetical protein
VFFLPLAVRGHDVFAAFGIGLTSVLEFSSDDGATWQPLETRTDTGVYRLALHGSDLYAGQTDGLWRRSVADVGVPEVSSAPRLSFALLGSQPIGDNVHFTFELPAAGPIAVDVFNVAGRRVASPIRGSWPAGRNEIAWDARALVPGFYLARLTAAGRHAVVRMVRVR